MINTDINKNNYNEMFTLVSSLFRSTNDILSSFSFVYLSVNIFLNNSFEGIMNLGKIKLEASVNKYLFELVHRVVKIQPKKIFGRTPSVAKIITLRRQLESTKS